MNIVTRQVLAGIRILLVFTVVLGIAYPVAVWGVGQAVARPQAAGSLVRDADGRIVGSSLIGQEFTAAKWFHGRPSAADYDGMSSGAGNLGPNNPKLVKAVTRLRAQLAEENGVPRADVPADAVTASGSGLDPDISPAYAAIQVRRVAAARHLPVATVRGLVAEHTQRRTLGFLGEPRVNVLELNLALERA